MTGTSARSSGEVLRQARRRDSRDKRARVLRAVEQMLSGGEALTFAAVARTANVSTWLVYAAGVREHILAARERQSGQAHDAAATIEQLRHDNATVSSRLEQAEEDLLGARASLRRMIRNKNTGEQGVRP
jgi:hypothetical protein